MSQPMGTSSLTGDSDADSRRCSGNNGATEGGCGGGPEGGGPNRPVMLPNVVTVGTHVAGGRGTLDAIENKPRGVADLESPTPDTAG